MTDLQSGRGDLIHELILQELRRYQVEVNCNMLVLEGALNRI